MLVNITEIKVKKRIRQDLGDLHPLIDSLKSYGLLNPIIISEKHELIAGERRLKAAQTLGWENIPVTINCSSDKLSQLKIEIEENAVRQDFSDQELFQGYEALEKLQTPPTIKRLWLKIKSFFSHTFSIKENRKKMKQKKNALLSLFLLIGILLVILETIMYQSGTNSIISAFLSILAIISIIIGLFYFIKFLTGFKK